MSASTKDLVLARLKSASKDYVSGSKIASDLGISRNSVWKAIEALRASGFNIKSSTNRGYLLVDAPQEFSAASIASLIQDEGIHVEFRDEVTSTNIVAKELAENGAPEGTLVVADTQTMGRGRQGRAFFSPPGTGVYFSLILRPTFSLEDVSLITSYAACCLAQTIDACTDKNAQIKWVNDVFVDGRKVSGILSEASFDAESQQLSYVVVGIGVNVVQPVQGFEGAEDIAGALITSSDDADPLRSQIVAGTIDRFMEHYADLSQKPHLEDYRNRSILDGKHVRAWVGSEDFDAEVIGVNDDFTLQVRLDDGSERALSSGEVHIPSAQLSA